MTQVFDDGECSVDVFCNEDRVLAMNRVESGVGTLAVSFVFSGTRTDRSKTRIVEESFSGRFLKNLMNPSSFSWSRYLLICFKMDDASTEL